MSTTLELGDCQSFAMNLEKVWLERGWIPFDKRLPVEQDGMIRCAYLSNYDSLEPGMRVFEYEETIPWNGWTKKGTNGRRKDGAPHWGHTHWMKMAKDFTV